LDLPIKPVDSKPAEWSLDLIKRLDWKHFEELCAAYFQAKGRKAKVTDLGADGGIDVLLYGDSDPNKVLGVVQCKAWTQKPVGVRQIRELLGVMTDVGCPLGVYVATSGYTPDAEAFAEGKHIKLMSAAQLLELIQKLPPEAQAKLLEQATSGDYTTPSCPSCGSKLVLRTARRGNRPGKQFWGCRNYPRCRYTMQAKSGER
jgi:restriction system protein